MQKKYVVVLTDHERSELEHVIHTFHGTRHRVRRAQILLKADRDGPNWTDLRIAKAIGCRTKTVENVRQRFVERGFRETLDGARRERPPVEKLLDDDQAARIVATHRSPPPRGHAKWTLRLLAKRVVELNIVPHISHETVRRTLKRWNDTLHTSVLGSSFGCGHRMAHEE